MIKQTSLEAYNSLIADGKKKTHGQRLYSLIQWFNSEGKYPSRADLCKVSAMPINAVCGRVNELLKRGVIDVVTTGICETTGKRVERLGIKYD